MFKNIIANITGRFWSIFSNYLFIPVYIKLLGIESYSIISFSLVILGCISVVDSGLTATLSKEFASKTYTSKEKYTLLSTLEYIYFILLLCLILFFIIFSHNIANNWLNLEELRPEIVTLYLKIIGIGLSFQLISSFYLGGLIGLEEQVAANKYQIIFGVFKNGIVIIIIFFNPSLLYFFLWQALVTIIYVLFLRYKLQSYILEKPHFSLQLKFEKSVLSKIWKFAAGMLVISIVASINTQLDKLVISKLLSIQQLGIYSIASSLSQGLFVIVTPISIALLPRFTALYSSELNIEAANLFHKILLIITILIFSISANLIFNAYDLMWAWTGDEDIANIAKQYIPFMLFGTSMLVLMMLPFDIAIANGYTKLNYIIGLLSICFTIPAYIIMIKNFGPKGAAIAWCTLQVIIAPIYFHLISKRFIKGKGTLILAKDVISPIVVSFMIAILLSYLKIETPSKILTLIQIGISIVITLMVNTILFVPKLEINQAKLVIVNFSRSLKKN